MWTLFDETISAAATVDGLFTLNCTQEQMERGESAQLRETCTRFAFHMRRWMSKWIIQMAGLTKFHACSLDQMDTECTFILALFPFHPLSLSPQCNLSKTGNKCSCLFHLPLSLPGKREACAWCCDLHLSPSLTYCCETKSLCSCCRIFLPLFSHPLFPVPLVMSVTIFTSSSCDVNRQLIMCARDKQKI